MRTLLTATTRFGTATLLRDARALFFTVVFPFLFVGLFALMRGVGAEQADGTPFDPMAWGIPAVLVMAFASLALYGTAQPLVAWRRRGTLRLLSTTTMPRSALLLGLAPARLGVGLVQVIAAAAIAAAFGVLEPRGLGWLVVSSTVALLFLGAVGLLLVAIFDNPEVMAGVAGMALAPVMILSGLFVPTAILPGVLRSAAAWNPMARIGELLRADLTGLPMDGDRLVAYLVVLAGTALVLAVALPLLSWERRADRRAATA